MALEKADIAENRQPRHIEVWKQMDSIAREIESFRGLIGELREGIPKPRQEPEDTNPPSFERVWSLTSERLNQFNKDLEEIRKELRDILF